MWGDAPHEQVRPGRARMAGLFSFVQLLPLPGVLPKELPTPKPQLPKALGRGRENPLALEVGRWELGVRVIVGR